ncbi:MAG: hypothetical protein U0800_05590 [Isosphaeraceae bacterium]
MSRSNSSFESDIRARGREAAILFDQSDADDSPGVEARHPYGAAGPQALGVGEIDLDHLAGAQEAGPVARQDDQAPQAGQPAQHDQAHQDVADRHPVHGILRSSRPAVEFDGDFTASSGRTGCR